MTPKMTKTSMNVPIASISDARPKPIVAELYDVTPPPAATAAARPRVRKMAAVAGAAAIFLTLGRAAAVAAGGGVTSYNSATMGFGRATLIEAIGTFMLVFVIFGVIDHRAVPGWAPMAIGSVVFAIIIILGPATGAAINPARYLGAFFMQDAFGGTVSWAQLPAYLIGEVVGGVLGGLAYVGIARVRSDAALTSLAPEVPGDEDVPEQRVSPDQQVSGATS